MNKNKSELDKNLVFIFYMGRSGSTYLSNSLVKKYHIIIPPEINFLVQILLRPFPTLVPLFLKKRLLKFFLLKDHKFNDWQLDINELLSSITREDLKSRESFLLKILLEYKNKHHNSSNEDVPFCFKKGSFTKHYDLISQHFPNAKYILLARDGRAIYNSRKNSKRTKDGSPFTDSVESSANDWVELINRFQKIRNKEKENALVVKYEDLIVQHDSTLNKLSNFLNLKLIGDEGKEYFVPDKYEILHKNIKKPPMKENINKWRDLLSNDEITTFNSIASKTLLNFDYTI